jgi:molybdopterin synthase catalytic subunit
MFLLPHAISPQFIADSIAKHSSKTGIGAHTIFLGQVRKDKVESPKTQSTENQPPPFKEVQSIEYSAYESMAEQLIHNLREAAISKYQLSCLHIHHSLGIVKAGEISLFVFLSAPHRTNVFAACSDIVEQLKHTVPIWGKEIFSDATHQWKQNI